MVYNKLVIIYYDELPFQFINAYQQSNQVSEIVLLFCP